MNLLLNKEFSVILEISKALKSGYIMFYGDRCYGINAENNIIKYVNINPLQMLNQIVIFMSSDITELGKVVKETKEDVYLLSSSINNIYTLSCNNISCHSLILPQDILNIAFHNINTINLIHNNTPLLVESNLRDNDDFNKILSLSASDGMELFNINGFIMSMFSSLLNINKSDSVSLTIYPFDNNTFLSRFSINKKKFILDINIRYMHMSPR